MTSLNRVSLEDYDGRGPRDKILNTPRSIRACQEIGVNPKDVFVYSEAEYANETGQKGEKLKKDYKKYIDQMDTLLLKLKQTRNDIVDHTDQQFKKVSKKKSSKKKTHKEHSENLERAKSDNEEEQVLQSKHIEKKIQDAPDGNEPDEIEGEAVQRKKKKHASSSVKPSKKMMDNFATTQYLQPKNKAMYPRYGTKQDHSRSLRVDETSTETEDLMAKLQRAQERLQRRQLTMLQSYQVIEDKRQKMMQRIQIDAIKQKRIEMMREEQKSKRAQIEAYKQYKRDEALQRNSYLEMEKARDIERKRLEKEQKALFNIKINQEKHKYQVVEQEREWEDKMDVVCKKRDIEEFQRGVAMAKISEKKDRLEIWL